MNPEALFRRASVYCIALWSASRSPLAKRASASASRAGASVGVFCTAAAFVCWGALIAAVGAGRALVVTYVNPVVAVVLGMALLGERPGVGAFVGLVLILAGSWLAAGGTPAH